MGPMQKRRWIAVLGAALVTVEACAASLSPERLVACAGLIDSAARLACYDREVAPLAREIGAPARDSSAAAPTPAPATAASAPAIATTSGPSLGQEQLTREQRPVPEKEELTLHARLNSQKSVGPGLFNLYLDNGQVWRHEDQVLGAYLKDGDAITIEKGALGGYKLTRDAGKSRNWMRVTRVR